MSCLFYFLSRCRFYSLLRRFTDDTENKCQKSRKSRREKKKNKRAKQPKRDCTVDKICREDKIGHVTLIYEQNKLHRSELSDDSR